jgi:hypothetical protein
MTKKKQQTKMDQLRRFTLKHVKLKLYVHLQTSFAAAAEGATERGEVRSRNTSADNFEHIGALFSAIKDIF